MKIMDQWLSEDGTYLFTKYSNGSIGGEPITTEEAALFEAARRY